MAEASNQLWLSLYKIVRMGLDRKRRKHFWVFVPTGERINFSFGSSFELWGKVKHDKEVYETIVMEAGLEGETVSDLDLRALNILETRLFCENVEKAKVTEEDIAVEKSSKERIQSKKIVYLCCICSSSFDLKCQLRKHIARKHVKRSYQCHLCPKKFARQDLLERHKLLHKRFHPHVCITCKKKYSTKFALLKHLEPRGFCPLQCIFCTQTFADKTILMKHDKLCRGDEEDSGGTCELCMDTFRYRIDLERHRKSFTNIDGSFKFVCGRCLKKCCSRKMLSDHMQASEVCPLFQNEKTKVIPWVDKMTENEYMYPCEKCGKTFGSKDLMMSHLVTHIESTKHKPNVDKPSDNIQCNHCLKKFARYSNYEKHKKLAYDDDGNLRNMCDKCSRSFCTSRLLKKHCNESHSVSCATCDETFTTKRALDSHIQKRVLFTCEQCKEIFCNKRAFSIHIGYAHILE